MIIYFVELEWEEEEYFRTRLSGHELLFVRDLEHVGEDAEVVSSFIYSSIDAAFLDAHPRLRCISTRSGTVEHVDLPACAARNVVVCMVPGYGDSTVAEHTFALMLSLSRRLRELMSLQKDAKGFSYIGSRGTDLCGKTLGIIGMGRIGKRVNSLAQAFRMRVVSFDPVEMPPEVSRSLGFTWMSLDDLLQASDIISLHSRLTPSTHHLLNSETLARCRPGVMIINTARGRLIDTQALQGALESGQVGGAGLDVLEEERVMRESASKIITDQIVENLQSDTAPHQLPRRGRKLDFHKLVMSDSLLARSNVVFTPHVAFNSIEAVERLNATTAQNILAFTEGQPVNLVEA